MRCRVASKRRRQPSLWRRPKDARSGRIFSHPTNATRCFAFQIARKESFPFEPSPIEFEMSGKTTVTSFKVAEKVADDADAVLQDLGMNFSSAVRLLALQTIAEGAIPFRAGA